MIQFQPRKQEKKVFPFIISDRVHLLRNWGDFKHNAIKPRNSHLALSVSLQLSVSQFFFSSLFFFSLCRFLKMQLSGAVSCLHGAMHYSEGLDLSFDVVKLKWQILRQAIHLWHLRKLHPEAILSQDPQWWSYLKLLGTCVWKVKMSQTKPANLKQQQKSFEIAWNC